MILSRAIKTITANWIISIELVGVASIIGAAFILPQQVPRPERRCCFHLVRGAAVAQENGLVASSIGGPSIVVVVGRVIFVTERTCVDPLSLI